MSYLQFPQTLRNGDSPVYDKSTGHFAIPLKQILRVQTHLKPQSVTLIQEFQLKFRICNFYPKQIYTRTNVQILTKHLKTLNVCLPLIKESRTVAINWSADFVKQV